MKFIFLIDQKESLIRSELPGLLGPQPCARLAVVAAEAHDPEVGAIKLNTCRQAGNVSRTEDAL